MIDCREASVDNAEVHVTAFRPVSDAAGSSPDDNTLSQIILSRHCVSSRPAVANTAAAAAQNNDVSSASSDNHESPVEELTCLTVRICLACKTIASLTWTGDLTTRQRP